MISRHSRADSAANGKSHLRWRHTRIGNNGTPHDITSDAHAFPPEAGKRSTITDPTNQVRRRGVCGLCHGGTSAQRDQRGCSCGRGIHAYGSGDGYLVEMCASRRSLSDVSSHIRGEIRALVDTSCGLTKKGYGARGASPNHPLQAAGSRTSLRPSPTARARTLQPHCRGFTSATFYSAADRHRTSNNIIVSYSHQGNLRVTPAYGMFSPMF